MALLNFFYLDLTHNKPMKNFSQVMYNYNKKYSTKHNAIEISSLLTIT